jgi:hypothetical protein
MKRLVCRKVLRAEETLISISPKNTLGRLHEHRNGRQMNDAGAALERFWGCCLRDQPPLELLPT